MSEYDFQSLNDKEFESLVCDLLSSHFNTQIEKFKPGKDQGVDGRFFIEKNKEAIIQSKHWPKTGLTSLLKYLKNNESIKVTALDPKKYIFATSLELSRDNKNKIKEIFSPFINKANDIFGNEDLNNLLALNKEIEQKHYKLWIRSTNVIRTILNAAIISRSKFKLEEIVEESKRYVLTENHNKAIKLLEEKHAVIITGSPGVGKTSLASQICQDYCAQGYEFCLIENSLNEAEEHSLNDEKQIFLFDDFLGSNYLQALEQHQDSQIVNFIKRIERNKVKRFILTSRTNILNQGKNLSELFENKNLNRNEFELEISSLSDLDKAKILYNHMWFSDLSEEYLDEIYQEKRYRTIIEHENFNPRLISFITDKYKIENIKPEKYWSYIEKTLSNPKDIWRNAFEVQIDAISRHITVAVALHGKEIDETTLKYFFQSLLDSDLVSDKSSSFFSHIKLLTGALLNRFIDEDEKAKYGLFNPSIADFIISNYLDNTNYINEILFHLNSIDSLKNLKSLYSSNSISTSSYRDILTKLMNRFLSQEGLSNYKLQLIQQIKIAFKANHTFIQYLKSQSNFILETNRDENNTDYYNFILDSLNNNLVSIEDIEIQNLIKHIIENVSHDYDNYFTLSNLVDHLKTSNPSLFSNLKNTIKKSVKHEISCGLTSDIIFSGIYEDLYYEQEYSPHLLESYLKDTLEDFSLEFNDEDIEELTKYFDMDELIETNRDAAREQQQQEDLWRDEGYSSLSTNDEIDDLFYRDD